MKKIWDFISKWGVIIALGIVGVALLFALGCCIYTAIANPFVGIVGAIGITVVLGVIVYITWEEISDGGY